MASAFTLSHPQADIALLTFDLPDKGANIFSRVVLEELAEHLASLTTRDDLAGLVIISGKPGTFIAGADIREFVASLGATKEEIVDTARQGQQLFQRLSQAPFVTVAAIDGICVGGGAELAVWCDRRVMSTNPKTEIGFPEVKLGLYPGWGGTARMPRMVGLGNAVEMITSGESIDARAAATLGLAEDVAAPERLLNAAIDVIRAEQQSGVYRTDRERWNDPVKVSETELGFLGVTASAYIRQQTKGQYPAPERALEVMLGAAGVDINAALEMEADGFSGIFGTPINASLFNVFFLTDRAKRDRGVTDDSIAPATLNTVSVLGAGIMGSGIAASNAKRDIAVTMMDPQEEALAKGIQQALEEVAYNKAMKTADAERAVRYAPLLNPTISDEELAQCDLLIEAIVEKAEIKKEVFQRLEPQLPEHAILASNTSTIPITSLAEGLARPEQFCGIHFFNPVRKMKLVEVIRGAATSDQTVATAVAHVKRLGKFPVVVNDGPGFLVNRLLLPYMNEALELIAEGAAIGDVERAAKKFGMPMGPFNLYDVVGLDTAAYAGRTMVEAFPDRLVASGILPAMLEAGRLGVKSGAGFFSYQNKKKRPQPDPTLDAVLAPHVSGQREFSVEEIQQRLFLPMLLEATRVLDEEIVRDPRDIDLGLVFGIGFPPFKGGLMFWADAVGAETMVEQLKPLEEIGPRFVATDMLKDLASSGGKFYPSRS